MAASGGPICDRCGRARPDRYRFCPSCSLFVCGECWDVDHDVCLSCSRPNLPVQGQMPAAIHSTIGRRPVVGASDTRIGRALTGPSADEEVAAPTAAGQRRRRPNLAAWLPGVTTIITSLILVAALFALPVLGRLLVGEPGLTTPSAATPEQSVMGATSSAHAARRWTVRSGDTLRSIARDVYGDEGRWLAIYRANEERIDDPDALQIGTTLVIP